MIRVLIRDIGVQFHQSKNIGESRAWQVRRAIWASVYVCRAFIIAFRMMRRECVGSQVIYKGRECFISNMANSSHPTLAAEGFYRQYVPRDQITNVLNIAELRHRFLFGFEFYMGSWHGIDVNRRLYPELTRSNA